MTPVRKSIRLKDHDYSACGTYFITVCTKDCKPIIWDSTVGAGGSDEARLFHADGTLWQKSFYDPVIRSEKEYLAAWQYIENNPTYRATIPTFHPYKKHLTAMQENCIAVLNV